MMDWGDVYTAYYRPVFSYVYNKLGHLDDAQDITADTFVKAMEADQRGCGCYDKAMLAPWLRRIARNTMIDRFRYDNRRPQASLDDLPAAADRCPTPHEEAEAAILADRLRFAMNFLPDGQQDVMALWAEGSTLCEIGQACGIATGAVKARLFRARAGLRCFADVAQE